MAAIHLSAGPIQEPGSVRELFREATALMRQRLRLAAAAFASIPLRGRRGNPGNAGTGVATPHIGIREKRGEATMYVSHGSI